MFPFSISRQRLLLGITLGLSILLMFVSSTWHDAFAQSGPLLEVGTLKTLRYSI